MAWALLLIAAATPALGAGQGTALGVAPGASATANATVRTLTVGADIFVGDTIATDATGLVQIQFADKTKLVVGPNSSLLIQDYLVRNDGSAGKFAIDMLSGTFRFITGNGPKTAYQITTPQGTIGIRGTEFDTFIDHLTGIAYVMMYGGQTELTSNADSELLEGLCYIGTIEVDDTKLIGKLPEMNAADFERIRNYFALSLDQSKLLESFRLSASPDCTKAVLKSALVPFAAICTIPTDLACSLTGGAGSGASKGGSSLSGAGGSGSSAMLLSSGGSGGVDGGDDPDDPPVSAVPLPASMVFYCGLSVLLAWRTVSKRKNRTQALRRH